MAEAAERRLTWRLAAPPLVLFAYVALTVFMLAKAHPFSPATPTSSGGNVTLGDAYSGELLFQDRCAGCHGVGGVEGGVGPPLAGTELDLAEIQAQIETGSGVMPGGLVTGDDLDDVLAYVATITSS